MTLVRVRNRFAVVTALVLTTALLTISAPTSAFASATSRCQETQLDVQLVPDGGSRGHVASLIVITNVSSTSCSVSGYPSVRVTDSPKAGFSLVAKDTLKGFMGGLGVTGTVAPVPKVKLHAHGGTASSMVEGAVAGSALCLWFKMMSVRLPHLSPGYRFRTLIPTCTLPQVHPFVKGTSGSTT
jgi:uncharacterized protein DUF4232